MNILLVEDDIKQFITIKKYIETNELGEVLLDNEKIIDNYECAISITKKINPDFAILDLEIKGQKSGIDIAKFLQKAKIPFFILTAYDTDENIEKVKKLNPLAFIYKTEIANDIRHLQNAIRVFSNTLFKKNNESFTLKMKTIHKVNDDEKEWQKLNNKYGDEYKVKPIRYEDIKYFTKSPNNKNYCLLIIDYKSNECFEIPYNLKMITDNLPNQFIRVSSEFIININEVAEYIEHPLTINLKGKKYIKVTDTYTKDVQLILKNHFPFLIPK